MERLERRWKDARRILAVRLDNLGDVLMTQPALRALRRAQPGRHVTLLASTAGARAAALIPDIDQVIPYEAPWMKSCRAPDPAGDQALIALLRQEHFDAAVIFTVYSQSPLPAALVCHLAGIPLRLAHCRENPYALLTHWLPETEPQQQVRHEVQRQLDLVASTGAIAAGSRMSLHVPEHARRSLLARFAAAGIDPAQPWAVVHPGATAASRRYPAPQFARALRMLRGHSPLQFIVTGDASERDLADTVCAAGAHCRSLVGQLELAEFAALIEGADLLVSNNTAPVHIASAVGTPVVDLYALTNPQHTPWQVPHRVLSHDVPCRNCHKSVCPEGHHRCLRGVSPRQVADAVLELTAVTRARRPSRQPLALQA